MGKLIMMRHGQSEWNKLNLFTGWVDIPLSEKGIEEAIAAGKAIYDIPVDIIYTSTLIRAHTTALLAMAYHASAKIPCVEHMGEGQQQEWGRIHSETTLGNTTPFIRAWQLNERCYGDLQGYNKEETAAKYGADQVHIWRRSFDVPPPNGESLKMTAERTLPFFTETIIPHLEKGENVLISAHGNSLRSIVMSIDGLSEDEVVGLEIPTGQPMVYEYSTGIFTKLTLSAND